jgi:hypothetical protein
LDDFQFAIGGSRNKIKLSTCLEPSRAQHICFTEDHWISRRIEHRGSNSRTCNLFRLQQARINLKKVELNLTVVLRDDDATLEPLKLGMLKILSSGSPNLCAVGLHVSPEYIDMFTPELKEEYADIEKEIREVPCGIFGKNGTETTDIYPSGDEDEEEQRQFIYRRKWARQDLQVLPSGKPRLLGPLVLEPRVSI